MYTVPGVVLQLGYTWESDSGRGNGRGISGDGDGDGDGDVQGNARSITDTPSDKVVAEGGAHGAAMAGVTTTWSDSPDGGLAVGGVSAGVPGKKEGMWIRAIGRMEASMRRVPVCENMVLDHLVTSIEGTLDRLCAEQEGPMEFRRLEGWKSGVRRPQLEEVLARKQEWS